MDFASQFGLYWLLLNEPPPVALVASFFTYILGHAEIASLQLTDHSAEGCIDQVLKASQRARDLVQQILAFSRQRTAEKKVLVLEGVVTEATKLLRASIPAANARRDNREGAAVAHWGDKK